MCSLGIIMSLGLGNKNWKLEKKNENDTLSHLTWPLKILSQLLKQGTMSTQPQVVFV